VAYNYDIVYTTPDYFGQPLQEILRFYEGITERGRLLDIGAGQGRDALPLAAMGYDVSAIDTSKTGIVELENKAIQRGLNIDARVHNLDTFDRYELFDFIHSNSVFYFRSEEKNISDEKRLRRIFDLAKTQAVFLLGFTNSDGRAEKLSRALAKFPKAEILCRRYIDTSATEKVSGLKMQSEYHFTVFRKGT